MRSVEKLAATRCLIFRPLDGLTEIRQIDELISLPPQVVCTELGIGLDGRYDSNEHAVATLEGFNKKTEVTISREKNDVVDIRCDLLGDHSDLDIHVPLRLGRRLGVSGLALSTYKTVGLSELLGVLLDDGEAVELHEINHWLKAVVFSFRRKGGEVVRLEDRTFERVEQLLVVDAETEGIAGSVEIAAIDKDSRQTTATTAFDNAHVHLLRL